MPYLTGFVVYPSIPARVTIEFWNRSQGEMLVSHAVPFTTVTPYQYYFSDEYFVQSLEDLDILLTEEIEQHLEIVPRFGDRNPLKIWG